MTRPKKIAQKHDKPDSTMTKTSPKPRQRKTRTNQTRGQANTDNNNRGQVYDSRNEQNVGKTKTGSTAQEIQRCKTIRIK